uniref:Uncharacterized protein n=1 Tax=Rhizophora mucronata TaxID=61149 RepID=A0A2P2KDW7_RHIMU
MCLVISQCKLFLSWVCGCFISLYEKVEHVFGRSAYIFLSGVIYQILCLNLL